MQYRLLIQKQTNKQTKAANANKEFQKSFLCPGLSFRNGTGHKLRKQNCIGQVGVGVGFGFVPACTLTLRRVGLVTVLEINSEAGAMCALFTISSRKSQNN